MASKPKIRKMYYRVVIEDNIKISSANFIKTVETILTDERTWKKYEFVNITDVNTDKKYKNYFLLILCSPAVIKKECNFHGLSCTNMSTKVIYINSHRWKRGAKKSGYSLEDYRVYLINHEVGHVLGHHHKKCNGKGKKIPVMNQATKGIGSCKPNIWPLEYEN